MRRVPLGDVAEFIRDGTHGSPVRMDVGVPVLSAMNIKDGRLNFETDRYTSDEEFEAFSRRVPLAAGDVLLTIVGTIGRAAVVQQIRPLVFQRSVAIVRPSAAALDSRFLYHVTQSLDFQTQLDRASNKSSQAGVYLGKLGNVTVPLPPLAEQRRIAAILDKADAVRTKCREAATQLDRLAQSIFVEMFGDPLTNPKRWPMVELGALADVQGGLQVTAARSRLPVEVPYLRVANVYRGRLDLREVKTIRATANEVGRTKLIANDMLVVEGHGNPEEVGRAALWNGEVENCVHQNHLIRVRFDPSRVAPAFACAYVNSAGGRQHLFRAGKTTSGLNTISVSNVRAVPIPLPALTAQKSYAERLSEIGRLKRMQHAADIEADALFSALQQRAFRGEL